MAVMQRAPKQWSLTKRETINSFENWRQNITYVLSLDPNFADFLLDGVTWEKKTSNNPRRGLVDDGEDIAAARRKTAGQKVSQLELMLGQIANFCPVISRNTIIKQTTSIPIIWQAIRLHFGFQSSGSHLLDFADIKLEGDERPEDLYQRIVAFVEDSLLKQNGGIMHHSIMPTEDEDMSPTLENFLTLHWLKLVHPDLPRLVKQRYGTELRSNTLASIKPEISQAMSSLLDELRSTEDAKIMRSFGSHPQPRGQFSRRQRPPNRTSNTTKHETKKLCPLCKQAGRTEFKHFLSECKFLPERDRLFMTKVRHVAEESCSSDSESDSEGEDTLPPAVLAVSRRVGVKRSPSFYAFYKQHPLQLTLDTGAELNMLRASVAKHIGAKVTKSSQKALQADGKTPLSVVGETHFVLSRGKSKLVLEALVVEELDVDVLAGTPFIIANDITLRPAKSQIVLQNSECVTYPPNADHAGTPGIRRTSTYLVRAPKSTVVWPGESLEIKLPPQLDPEAPVAVEPHGLDRQPLWPTPSISQAVAGKLRIINDTNNPQDIKKHEHFCQVSAITEPSTKISKHIPVCMNIKTPSHRASHTSHSKTVKVNPDNIATETVNRELHALVREFDQVFDPEIGYYNGASGDLEAVVNMGPTLPPQRKGRLPQYAHNRMVELQCKMDELERIGVLRKPEEMGIQVEYVNPSFLVKKPDGGSRLVTAFADVGRYAKPQPSLMPDVDSTLRQIAKWKYIAVMDLKSAFYQIPLAKESMKYCGIVTPFKGIRVYARCAMGMPGSETALEELMSRVLGELLQDGIVAKIADDLFCGGDNQKEFTTNLRRLLQALCHNNLRLSGPKCNILPRTVTVLGWIWSDGTIRASAHRLSTLSTCKPPVTIKGMRAFIGAFRAMSRVIPACAALLSPLEDVVAGNESADRIVWTEQLSQLFTDAQAKLSSNKTITLPRPSDQLWIVTDASIGQNGIGATVYITRAGKLYLSGFFSAKLRPHQVRWLPCEVEALAIATSIKHFAPYLIQSEERGIVLTDSKPCVQAVEKLCRGEFSNSPRMTTFLSTVSQYQMVVRHLSGAANIPSDFASRNAPECPEQSCQVCSFVNCIESSVVRSVSVKDVMDGSARLPFTTRSTWIQTQHECSDLRRAHAHLAQGTRPSKKLTHIGDVKRYLRVASIAKDGLLVVRQNKPLAPSGEAIIVPRQVLNGLLVALHIRFKHPSANQLKLMCQRYFFALDLDRAIRQVSDSCHTCVSLKSVNNTIQPQSTEEPPDTVGRTFAADVIKRSRQLILVVRETVTSYTVACLVEDEKCATLRRALITLCVELCPLDGPFAVIRVDGAPGLAPLLDDEWLRQHRITVEVGRTKNPNKNPVAERAVQELIEEIMRQEPGGGPVSIASLSVAVATLNTRIRSRGLSAREMWTQRDQYSHAQLPMVDRELIMEQHATRIRNHPYSEHSKAPTGKQPMSCNAQVGDLVYVKSDLNKTRARDRYLVVQRDDTWCRVKKFTDRQLRPTSYKVRQDECLKIPITVVQAPTPRVAPYTPYTDIPSHLSDIPDTPNALLDPSGLEEPSPEMVMYHPTLQDVTDPQPDVDEQVIDSHSCPQTVPISEPKPRRSIRTRLPPKHLNEYVLN